MTAVKQTTFEEYQETLSVICKHIDKQIDDIKKRQKNLPVWEGHKSYKDFLNAVEKNALKEASEELNLGNTTVRDRWKVLTLPIPVFSAIEEGSISFSKAKLITSINFNFDADEDIAVAEEIVQKIKDGLSNDDIKELVKEKATQVWNHKNIAVERVVAGLGITADSTF